MPIYHHTGEVFITRHPGVNEHFKLFPAPKLKGAAWARYIALFKRIYDDLQPPDILGDMWLRNIVDLEFEIDTYRRHKAGILHVAVLNLLNETLQILTDWDTAVRLTGQWSKHDAAAAREVGDILARAGLSISSLKARAFKDKVHQIERIERAIASAELRRNQALRELERHRALFEELKIAGLLVFGNSLYWRRWQSEMFKEAKSGIYVDEMGRRVASPATDDELRKLPDTNQSNPQRPQ